MKVELKPVSAGIPTFVEAPPCERLEDLEADVAVIGISYKSPYEVSVPLVTMEPASSALSAPDALRRQSATYAHSLRHYDFDFGGDLFAGREVRISDCGDLGLESKSHEEQLEGIAQAIRLILNFIGAMAHSGQIGRASERK